jgi:Uma2 family endonuclease
MQRDSAMSSARFADEGDNLVLHFGPLLRAMGDREFLEICRLNPDWRIESTAEGDLVIMAPTGGRTGQRNFTLTGLFFAWVEAEGSGVGFDSSTIFLLPNGARRSPDVAWVTKERWETLSEDEQEGFPPICPDFVIELRSPSDSLATLQAKMDEYVENGARLGWLIDPFEKRVYVYRPGRGEESLDNPASLRGDPELRGFVFPVSRLWK